VAGRKPLAKDIPNPDLPIAKLVDALNEFVGIETIGSCGGHATPKHEGQWPEGTWYVKFRVGRNAHGWRALEFLAWLVNNDSRYKAGRSILLVPDALPPMLNTPGRMLTFVLEGERGENADRLADEIRKVRKAYYVPPRGARHS
jgi:hypothetical protein